MSDFWYLIFALKKLKNPKLVCGCFWDIPLHARCLTSLFAMNFVVTLHVLIISSYLSIWGHHKKGEKELSCYGGVFAIMGEILKLIYMVYVYLISNSIASRRYLLCLMCVGTKLKIIIAHPDEKTL